MSGNRAFRVGRSFGRGREGWFGESVAIFISKSLAACTLKSPPQPVVNYSQWLSSATRGPPPSSPHRSGVQPQAFFTGTSSIECITPLVSPPSSARVSPAPVPELNPYDSRRLHFKLMIAQKLDENNFHLWRQQVEPYINAHDLTDLAVISLLSLSTFSWCGSSYMQHQWHGAPSQASPNVWSRPLTSSAFAPSITNSPKSTLLFHEAKLDRVKLDLNEPLSINVAHASNPVQNSPIQPVPPVNYSRWLSSATCGPPPGFPPISGVQPQALFMGTRIAGFPMLLYIRQQGLLNRSMADITPPVSPPSFAHVSPAPVPELKPDDSL
ncbi:hypothetical protein KIW84_066560 [Lathyrus oleraceus]|uniref:Uncharacterized protein n=1 Tax=Pisum sativum TaxID=3888 RepID=A0A9D4WG48_PEA|nr:hypothetical protein KIW84_066560 [Pisum sativum]